MTNLHRSLFLTAALALCGHGLAQTPDKPPPWWGVADEDTVSLFWDFNNPVTPLAPTFAVLPSWYSPVPSAGNNFGFTNTNITWLPSLAGNTGVLSFTGPGSGTIENLIDNDPRPYWIKIFYLQFDSLGSVSGDVVAEVEKALGKYQRAIIEETKEPLANGWVRTTIGMYLIPQPIDEKIVFDLSDTGINTLAIDNLYVDSKCVKPPPDEVGKAYGEVDPAFLINLTASTGNPQVTAVAATEDAANNVTLWVASRSAANADEVVRLAPNGTLVGSPILLPQPVAAAGGASDLAVAKIPVTGPTPGVRTLVYSVLDRRAANGTVALVAIDADQAVPVVVPAQQVTIPGAAIPGPGPFALAYSPHGDVGGGSFFLADQAGNVTEVARRTGVVLRTLTNAANGIPLGISGATFDPFTAQFYWFSSTPTPTPQGPTQIMIHEHDGYSMQPTGVLCLGDTSIPNPGGPPGGVARGLELLRRNDSSFLLFAVQQAGGQQFLRAIRGPWRFGWSLLGRVGTRGGLPMQGNPNWQVTLRGVPHATFAICFAGFATATTSPLPLNFLGMDESFLSISLNLQSPIVPVSANGTASWNPGMPPPGTVPTGTNVFFQWLVFDASVSAGMASSQTGGTVIY